MRPVLRALGLLSIVELASIGLLLLNLITFHYHPLAAALGPIHGAFYLSVAVTALLARGITIRTRMCALIPVAGGMLTLINIRAESRASA